MMGLLGRIFNPADSSIELHDVAGVGVLGANLSALGVHISIALHQVTHGVQVDLAGFGTGAAALLGSSATIIGALGAAGWMKGKQRQADPACQQKEEE